MTQTRMATWRVGAAILTVLCGVTSRAEVTVVGSSVPPLPQSDNLILSPDAPQPGMAEASSGMPVSSSLDSDSPFAATSPVYAAPWITLADRPLETNWYARFDYYNWTEQGIFDTSEHGTMFNMGFLRSAGAHRLRFELFQGRFDFSGVSPAVDIDMDGIATTLGFRTECDFLWDLNCNGWQNVAFFSGIGTRFWIRDIHDGVSQATGAYVAGVQETWWTLFFHVGLEKKWEIETGGEVFVSGRVGCTPFTYERTELPGQPLLFPNPGVTGQIEGGFRYEGFLCSVYFDAMGWTKSAMVDDWFQQPGAQMFSTGLKLGFIY